MPDLRTAEGAPKVKPEQSEQPIVAPEAAPEVEHSVERNPVQPGSIDEGKTGSESTEAASLNQQIQSVTQSTDAPKDEVLEEIEDILEEDLDEVFSNLPEDKRGEFKEIGEETATEIRGLVGHMKVKAGKIFHLIKKWLKIIPGVNRFFLEQEAKIKTDEILDLAEEEKNKGVK